MKTICLTALAILFLIVTGCGSSRDVKKSNETEAVTQAVTKNNSLREAPDAWLGETPHFVMIGRVHDYLFNIQILDTAAQSELLHAITGKREYQINPSTGEIRFVEFEINLQALMGGVEREVEIEFGHGDYKTVDIPATLSVVKGENSDFLPDGIRGEKVGAKLEWEWEVPGQDIFVEEEAIASGGTFYLALDSGTGGSDGTKDGGSIGGYLKTQFDEENSMVISFTFPMSESEEDREEVGAFYE